MKETINKIRELYNEVGYENFRKAWFIYELGKEEEIDNPKLIQAIDKLYDYYMETDYFCSSLDTQLVDKFETYYEGDEIDD